MSQNYTYWRLSQGFSKPESDILYQKDHSTQEVLGLKCWLKSIEPHQISNIQLFNNTMISLQKKLHKHSSELSNDLLGRISLMLPTLESSTELAFTGRYLEAFILLRSSIEGMFRLFLDLVYKYQRKDLGLWKLKHEDWNVVRESGLIEGGANIGAFDTIIHKLKINSPFSLKRSIYKYLNIKALNKYTHAAVEHIVSDRSSHFSQEKKDKYVEFYNRTTEVIVILCQNLIDKLEPSLGSLVSIRDIEEESMPMLYALIDGRD